MERQVPEDGPVATEDSTFRRGAERPATPPMRVFTVRLWKEEVAGGSEYRGSVRDIRTDAFRGFRDWSDLVAFMVSRIEQRECRRDGQVEGE